MLQEVLAPAGWGQRKLALARWSQTDLVAWNRNNLVEALAGQVSR
jgi:hypothetical protein